MKIRRYILLVSVILIASGALRADEPATSSTQAGIQETEVRSKLNLARQLMGAKNYSGASAILEGLFEQSPDNQPIQSLLFTCYLHLDLHTKAESLARLRVEQAPSNPVHRLRLAEVLVKQGFIDEGLSVYDDAIELIEANNPYRYLMIIRSLISHDLEVRALELIDTIRAAQDTADLFALERGSILEMQKEWAGAAEEYIPLLAEDTTARARDAERRLLALLSFEESAAAIEELLLADARQTQSVRLLKLMNSHYLRNDRLDEAFDIALRNDSLEGSNGIARLHYMRRCRELGLHMQVVRMGEYSDEQDSTGPLALDILFEYADGLTQVGRPHDAISVYRRIVDTYPGKEAAADAYYGIGAVYYDHLNECDKALVSFKAALNIPSQGVSSLNARKGLPYCHLRLGQLNEAANGFSKLAESNLNEEIAEEMAYNLACIKLYQKQYDSAEVALRKIMVDYPRGYFVNDALQLVMLIGEVKDSEDLLYDYSNALYFEKRLMYDSARVRMNRLSGSGNAAADIALFRLTELEISCGDTASALETVARLLQEFPDSYYLPYGLRIKADVLSLNPETQDEAEELYSRLLQEYPNYPFISDVRRKLREMETDRRIG